MAEPSPLAPKTFPELAAINGVRLGAMHAGIRYAPPRPDLLVAELAEGTVAAGVFTRSLTASAPVEWCKQAVASGQGARLLIVNSGNSNAFTGKLGIAAVEANVKAANALNGSAPNQVFIASTGVIGEPLPHQKISDALPKLYAALSPDGWNDAARAIMTTDTFRKVATAQVVIDGKTITINGIAKGSGMIAPDMATMLGFIFTDAAVSQAALQSMLTAVNDRSFNAITVDGDTSTSDTVLLFATGKAGNTPITAPHAAFEAALETVLVDLAKQIIRDGEGASKFVTITVEGAEHDAAARRIGLSIANSPLVKTAIAGSDPNWGRLVMAVGKAGERADRDALKIWIGGHLVAAEGQRVADYNEAPLAAHMKTDHVDLRIDVGIAQGKSTVWTCDFTKRYIEINADYRS